MNKRKRLLLVSLLLILWGGALSLFHTLMAPILGAATVQQMEASNASYLASMSVISGVSWISILISLVFVALIYLTVRSK